jgi:hypothetical protein
MKGRHPVIMIVLIVVKDDVGDIQFEKENFNRWAAAEFLSSRDAMRQIESAM